MSPDTILTVSRRFEFCASHVLRRTDWSQEKNDDYYGSESLGDHGHGHNYEAFFGFDGEVDDATGMLTNLATVKKKLTGLLSSHFDHKNLNVDSDYFKKCLPTPENIASVLLNEALPFFESTPARPVVCHLRESSNTSATAYHNGRIERHFRTSFSAARRTCSPHLSDEENMAYFGQAASSEGHGHNYRLLVTVCGKKDEQSGQIISNRRAEDDIRRVLKELDHKHLNRQVPDFSTGPVTTECLARYIFEKLSAILPVDRVRLHELDDFFAEHHSSGDSYIAVSEQFHAAHRLHRADLSDEENTHLYGKCNNPNGHGHNYTVEVTVAGKIDKRTGTVASLNDLQSHVRNCIKAWNYRHLDLECDDFVNRPSTGENIVQSLWLKLEKRLGASLHRIRLSETTNNRFAIRRSTATTSV